MIQFFETGMGKKFFESTMPALVKCLKSIADSLTGIANALREASSKPDPETTAALRSIAESMEKLTKHLEPETEERFIVLRNSGHLPTLVCNEGTTSFKTQLEAWACMEDDILATFNASGWENGEVKSTAEIHEKGYFLQKDWSMKIAVLSRKTPITSDEGAVYWSLIKVTI